MRRIYFDDGNQTTTGMNQMMKTVINAEDTKQRANLPSSPRQGTTTRFKSRRAPKKTRKNKRMRQGAGAEEEVPTWRKIYVRTYVAAMERHRNRRSRRLIRKEVFFSRGNKQTKKRWKAKGETCDDVASTHEMRKRRKTLSRYREMREKGMSLIRKDPTPKSDDDDDGIVER